MIAFYETNMGRHHDPSVEKWKKWCKTNEAKRKQLMSRLNVAVVNRDKALETDLRKQIKKIDELRFN